MSLTTYFTESETIAIALTDDQAVVFMWQDYADGVERQTFDVLALREEVRRWKRGQRRKADARSAVLAVSLAGLTAAVVVSLLRLAGWF